MRVWFEEEAWARAREGVEITISGDSARRDLVDVSLFLSTGVGGGG